MIGEIIINLELVFREACDFGILVSCKLAHELNGFGSTESRQSIKAFADEWVVVVLLEEVGVSALDCLRKHWGCAGRRTLN